MIYTNISIRNPFVDRNRFENLGCQSGMLTQHKAWEVQIMQTDALASFTLNIAWRGTDHAGPSLGFGLFGYEVDFKIYDTRHWNSRKNCWEVHTD